MVQVRLCSKKTNTAAHTILIKSDSRFELMTNKMNKPLNVGKSALLFTQ